MGSSYFVAGDASKMDINKVILTYTNESKKILTGNMIKGHYSHNNQI